MRPDNMHPKILKEIPDFIQDAIVYCDYLAFNKDEASCFLLDKNLKLYEFRKKQLRNCLDLNETCLKVFQKKMQTYTDESKASVSQTSSSKQGSKNINLGKYIYRNFEISKLYLLLHCWDKLIVMEHNSTNGLKLISEYEQVTNFKIVPSTLIKYQAELSIQFSDESITCTNFQNDAMNNASNTDEKVTERHEFKHLIDRVRTTKAELQLHKEITQKQFQSLCNAQNFGNNFIRSTKLEEKYMLSRCGDLWLRVTATDDLVLGLPLVNNCAPPNLTILKNLQPILKIVDEESKILTNEHESNNNNNLSFEHQFYELRQTFENLETLETFFQAQEENFENASAWRRNTTNQLLPNSFIVLLLKFKLSQLIFINSTCQLFVRFEVEKDLETYEPKLRTFEQHLFVKDLDFKQFLHERSRYEISFQSQTLHQDLLAIAMISDDTNFHIEFKTKNDFEKFERLLVNKFDFEIVHRTPKSHTSCDATAMDVDIDADDNDDEVTTTNFSGTLYYNRKRNSLWFGSFIMLRAIANADNNINSFDDDDEPFETNWIFYNKNEEKSLLMFKLLFDELLLISCNVNNMKTEVQQQNCQSKIITFENAIREELKTFSDLTQIQNNPQQFQEKYKKLAEHQFYTDLVANNI